VVKEMAENAASMPDDLRIEIEIEARPRGAMP